MSLQSSQFTCKAVFALWEFWQDILSNLTFKTYASKYHDFLVFLITFKRVTAPSENAVLWTVLWKYYFGDSRLHYLRYFKLVILGFSSNRVFWNFLTGRSNLTPYQSVGRLKLNLNYFKKVELCQYWINQAS